MPWIGYHVRINTMFIQDGAQKTRYEWAQHEFRDFRNQLMYCGASGQVTIELLISILGKNTECPLSPSEYGTDQCFASGSQCFRSAWSGSRTAKMTYKNRKSEEISSFEMLGVLFLRLKASPIAWTSFQGIVLSRGSISPLLQRYCPCRTFLPSRVFFHDTPPHPVRWVFIYSK